MAKTVIQKVLVWKQKGKKDKELPAIPNLSPDEMLEHYSLTHPELATATFKDLGIVNGRYIYEINETLGEKG